VVEDERGHGFALAGQGAGEKRIDGAACLLVAHARLLAQMHKDSVPPIRPAGGAFARSSRAAVAPGSWLRPTNRGRVRKRKSCCEPCQARRFPCMNRAEEA